MSERTDERSARPADDDPRPGDQSVEQAAGREAVTRILQHASDDDRCRDELLPLVYDQLHAIARRRMSGERRDHTLQATVLVSEAYMRLVGDGGSSFENRRHFYRAAGEAMRRILIDHARRRSSLKRGGGKPRAPLDVVDLAEEQDPAQILALDEALQTLEEEDERAAEVVRLRFFAGLEVDEVAEVMEVSPRTVAREWAYARARLFQLLAGEGG